MIYFLCKILYKIWRYNIPNSCVQICIIRNAVQQESPAGTWLVFLVSATEAINTVHCDWLVNEFDPKFCHLCWFYSAAVIGCLFCNYVIAVLKPDRIVIQISACCFLETPRNLPFSRLFFPISSFSSFVRRVMWFGSRIHLTDSNLM